MRPLVRIVRLWRAEWPGLVLGLVVVAASSVALAGLSVSAGAAPIAAGALVLLLRGLGAGRVILRYVERLLTHAATFRALTALRLWMVRGLATRSAGGLGFMRRGDALARLVGDVDALDGVYLRIIVPAVAATVLLLAVIVVLAPTAPGLAVVVGLLFATAGGIIPYAVARAMASDGAALAVAQSGLRVALLDALGGLREVRAFGNEGRMLALVQAREAAVFAAQRGLSHAAAIAQAASILCSQAALLLVILAGLPVPLLLPAVLLTLAAFEAVSALPRAGALAGRASAAAQRVLEAAAAPDLQPPDPPHPAPPPRRAALRFEAVRFAWPGRAPTLEGLTMEVPAGSRVAILGPSGAGKSTLAALALKVVAPGGGRVLLGETDLADLAAADVRSRIAWLSQSTHVFADTIRDNLALATEAVPDDAALWQALNQVGLADVVQALPDGLDTWVGEGGAGLSGGQLRRLALARTLLSPAPILILDEPATGLDDAAERAFFMALNAAAPGRTIILIVHRLLGIERLDRIWRLSAGRAMAAAG